MPAKLRTTRKSGKGARDEPARPWGHTPGAYLAMAAMYGALDHKPSLLTPALRSLVQVRVSRINGCPFCIDLNSAHFDRPRYASLQIDI